MPSKLGYWKIRGLGQQIRLLLKYVEEEFEDVRYPAGPEVGEGLPSDYTQYIENRGDYGDRWFKEKFTHGLDFPNIPYYKDDKVNITQSFTIMRYLARNYDLGGKTEEENVRLDLIADEGLDFFWEVGLLCFDPNFADVKDEFRKKLPQRLQQFEEFLGDRPWMVGTHITWVDFFLYDNLDRCHSFWPDCFKDCPKLTAFLERFQSIPQMAAYIASDDYLKELHFSTFARHGGLPGQAGPIE